MIPPRKVKSFFKLSVNLKSKSASEKNLDVENLLARKILLNSSLFFCIKKHQI